MGRLLASDRGVALPGDRARARAAAPPATVPPLSILDGPYVYQQASRPP